MTPHHADESDAMIEALTAAVMRQLGWLVPIHEDDVADDVETPLPPSLAEPAGVWEGHAKGGTLRLPPTEQEDELDVEAALRRAAREGGTISPDVAAAMRRDRRAAEGRPES
ncbi:MAG: hypothetical protein IT440_06755 [Phycisphaeraceae bacterium]|nr:hypothetical protein [Phycisphaeraceae bacterium]